MPEVIIRHDDGTETGLGHPYRLLLIRALKTYRAKNGYARGIREDLLDWIGPEADEAK